MGIVSAREIGPRGMRFSLDGLSREYTRTFQVITDDPEVEMLEVLSAGGLPQPGDYYNIGGAVDYGALVDGYDPRQDDPDHPDVWTVAVTYRNVTADPAAAQGGATAPGSPPAPGGGGSPGSPQNSNPIFARPTIQWGTRTVLRPILTDYDGDAIVNSAGTPFEVQMEEIKCLTMRYTRNELHYNPFTLNPYKGAMNGTVFQTRPISTVLCEDITAAYAFSDGIGHHQVTYDFVFGPADEPFFWYSEFIDKGPRYKTSSVATAIPYHDRNGNPAEIYLNGTDGQKHSSFDLDSGTLALGSQPNFRRFRIRRWADFGDLNLIDPAWL